MTDPITTFDYIQQRMIEGGLIFTGCSDNEIAALETQFDIHFPAMYRRFLAQVGKFIRNFLVGTDWTYAHVRNPDLRSHAESLIAEANTSYQLPKNAFVFCMHQGYSFLFFHAVVDDPPIWLYVENDVEPKKVAPSFTSWLLDTVVEQTDLKTKYGAVSPDN